MMADVVGSQGDIPLVGEGIDQRRSVPERSQHCGVHAGDAAGTTDAPGRCRTVRSDSAPVGEVHEVGRGVEGDGGEAARRLRGLAAEHRPDRLVAGLFAVGKPQEEVELELGPDPTLIHLLQRLAGDAAYDLAEEGAHDERVVAVGAPWLPVRRLGGQAGGDHLVVGELIDG